MVERFDNASNDTSLTVDRALSEVRRGGLVAISESGMRDQVILVASAEMATEATVNRLRRLAFSEPSLLLSAPRLSALTGRAFQAPASVALPKDGAISTVQSLIDPTEDGQRRNAPLTLLSEGDGGGATAAAIDLVKRARLLPSAIVSRIAGLKAAEAGRWAREASILLVTHSDVEQYRQSAAARLVMAAEARVPLEDAEDASLIAFRPVDGGLEHVAVRIGSPSAEEPVLVRIHSQCLTGDLLGSLRCDCGDQLRGAIREIARQGSGILLYIAQEGRDIGLINKLRAYSLQDLGADTVDANMQLGFEDDERVYYPAAEMLKKLGVIRVRLMTNNPAKLSQLAECGVEVVDRVPHIFPSNKHNERYLAAKAAKSGHML